MKILALSILTFCATSLMIVALTYQAKHPRVEIRNYPSVVFK